VSFVSHNISGVCSPIFGSNQMLCNLYLLNVHKARCIRENEQRLLSWEVGSCVRVE
jgi:hypothetical protein